MAERHDQQGTGKHGHKDSQEPWLHTKDEGRQHSRGNDSNRSDNSSEGRGQSGSENADLKSREYKDEKGETHHHTRTYMEDHEGKKGR